MITPRREDAKGALEHCDECAPEFTECWNDGSKCRKRPQEPAVAAPRQSAADCAHDWHEEYYGTRCSKCGTFYAIGHEPWSPQGHPDNDDGGAPTNVRWEEEHE